MRVLAPFPDAEDIVMSLLAQVAATVQTTPPDFTPPLIQVIQTGGSAGQIDTRPVVEVACFGDTYAEAKEMAAECEQIILAARATTAPDVPGYPDGVFIDKTEIVQTPREIPYQDREKRRKTATYRLIYRRPSLPQS